MAAETHWDRHNDADRVDFAKLLAPLVIASRTKAFSKAEASVYLLTLQDVPRDILALGVTRLLAQGVTWMPKPGDIKAVCCDVVDERRKVARAEAERLFGDCPDCCDGWRSVITDGRERVQRCTCFERKRQLIEAAGLPLARPALAAMSEDSNA